MLVLKKIETKTHQIFHNNEWVDSLSGRTFPCINPCDESVICEVAEGDKVVNWAGGNWG